MLLEIEDGALLEDYQKALNKSTLFFFPELIPFHCMKLSKTK